MCGSSQSRTSTLRRILTSLSWSSLFFSLNSALCISRLMTDYWCCIDLLWMQNKGRSEDPAASPGSFFARFLTEISLRTECLWNSRRSHRFMQALGLLIHHLINSALLYSDLGPVPIFLLHTSDTLSAQLMSTPVGNCKAVYSQKILPSDAFFMWNGQNLVYKSKYL